jgi:hypothetical protein
MTPVDILKAARELIAKPERWTRGTFARNLDGHPVPYDTSLAASFCALGAICHIATLCPRERTQAECMLRGELPTLQLVSAFNDSHDHPEVLALFDRAIAKAGAQ